MYLSEVYQCGLILTQTDDRDELRIFWKIRESFLLTLTIHKHLTVECESWGKKKAYKHSLLKQKVEISGLFFV